MNAEEPEGENEEQDIQSQVEERFALMTAHLRHRPEDQMVRVDQADWDWLSEDPEDAINRGSLANFLEMFANTGRMAQCCQAAGFSIITLRKYRAEHPEIGEMIDAAREVYVERIEDALHQEGVEGILEPVFHNGQICGYVRKRNVKAAELLLKKHKPNEYGTNRQEVEHKVTGGVMIAPAPMTIEGTALPVEDVNDD